MIPFLVFGTVFTLLILAGGAVIWVIMGRQAKASAPKRRHRDEARRLQLQFEADEDFTHNFHRPTQNEVLETLQALDHLTVDWQQGDPDLVDHRFKNELAASFPALRKSACVYPRPITGDVARLAGKKKLSVESLEARRLQHEEQTARMRAQFHAVRAQANALHQITSGPDVGPVEVTAGSLPFRVSEEEATRSRRPAVGSALAAAAALLVCLSAVALYAARKPGQREGVHPLAGNSKEAILPRTTPTPAPALAQTAVPSPALPAAVVEEKSVSPEPASPIAGIPAPEAGALAPAAPANPALGAPPAVVAEATPIPPVAPPAATPTPAATPAPPTLAELVAFSKARAVDKHPDLMEPNTEINLRFVFRYKKMLEEKSPRLQDPNWPEKLADECASAVVSGPVSKPHKASQSAR